MTGMAVLPSVRLAVNGRPVPDPVHLALVEVVIRQRLSQPTVCELLFADGSGAVARELDTLLTRNSDGVALHADGYARPLFTGLLTAIDYAYEPADGPLLRLRAADPLARLQRRQPVRGHLQLTLPEIARLMVADLGLSVRSRGPEPVWQTVVQHDRTDLAVLVDLAERSGLYFFLADPETLSFFPLSGDGERTLDLTLGATLLSLRATVDTGAQCGAVTAVGWDPWRMSQQRATVRAGQGFERTLAVRAFQSESQARALAQGELDRQLAARVTAEGTARGNPDLHPGRSVLLRGVNAAIAGPHVLTAVSHRIDRVGGYVSTFETAPPSVHLEARATLLAPGVVSRVDDPDGTGRVRMVLPGMGGIETAWLQVLTAAAGTGKGLIALPDVGDHVLALLVDGDPGQGIVIGSAFGETVPVDSGAEGDGIRRFTFATAGGQTIRLDDGQNRLRVESADGSCLEMGRNGVRLEARGDLEIAAPGRRIRVRGAAIDFERG